MLVRGRRGISLRSTELAVEVSVIALKADKREAAYKEGASNARDEEARVLKENKVECCSVT